MSEPTPSCRFADFSTTLRDTERDQGRRRRDACPGVLAAEGRLIQDVSLELDEDERTRAIARIVGLPNRAARR